MRGTTDRNADFVVSFIKPVFDLHSEKIFRWKEHLTGGKNGHDRWVQ